MAHRASKNCSVRFNFEYLKASLDLILRGADWTQINWRSDCTWTARLLAATALLWSWSIEPCVKDGFKAARRLTLHMYPQTEEVGESFQGFLKLLIRWNEKLATAVKHTLQKRMQEEFVGLMKIGKFVIMAVDGSRIGLPRTKSCETAFCAKHNKRKKKSKKRRSKAAEKKADAVTMWITTLWHCGTGLPWNWRQGPSNSSERQHWMDMLKDLTFSVLFVGDAGFVGYECARAVIDAQHQLLIRVGSNVRLIKHLGSYSKRGDLVHLWPDQAIKRNQPPLVFRLVVCFNGKHPVYLLTSVLSHKELSDQQVVEVYKKRWGIELFYRHLKQTFGKRKLRSRSADAVHVEMTWSFLGLWCMALHALKKLQQKGIEPTRLSFAKLIRAFRCTMRDYLHPADKTCNLDELLENAVIDDYVRGDRTSRDYPRKKKQDGPVGPPTIRAATKQEIELAKRIMQKNPKELGLTA